MVICLIDNATRLMYAIGTQGVLEALGPVPYNLDVIIFRSWQFTSLMKIMMKSIVSYGSWLRQLP